MTGTRRLRVWGVALWALCLLALTGTHQSGARGDVPGRAPPTVVGVLSAVADPAVLPPRPADEVRVATSGAPLRLLVLAAALAVLAGLPAAQRRRSSTEPGDHQPLRARRHTIALRAPPLQLA